MALERMQVTNHERWGKLVKTWSTGKNYLEDDNEYPLPTRRSDEFKEQLAKAQVFTTVPDRYKQSHSSSKQQQDTITVRCRPTVMIEDSEEQLNQPGATYPLPPFYKRLFNGMDPVIPESREVQGACRTYRRLHHQRLRLKSTSGLVTSTMAQCLRPETLRRASRGAGFPIAP